MLNILKTSLFIALCCIIFPLMARAESNTNITVSVKIPLISSLTLNSVSVGKAPTSIQTKFGARTVKPIQVDIQLPQTGQWRLIVEALLDSPYAADVWFPDEDGNWQKLQGQQHLITKQNQSQQIFNLATSSAMLSDESEQIRLCYTLASP